MTHFRPVCLNKLKYAIFILLLATSGLSLIPTINAQAQAAKFDNWPSLSTKQLVRVAQYLLRARGFPVLLDGKAGPQMRTQIKSFQQSRRLKANGIVDDRTWDALVLTVKRGARGDAVRAVQELLNESDKEIEGHPLQVIVDSKYGIRTEQAVKRFQRIFSLKVDGIVGPETWRWLAQGATENKWYD